MGDHTRVGGWWRTSRQATEQVVLSTHHIWGTMGVSCGAVGTPCGVVGVACSVMGLWVFVMGFVSTHHN